MPHTSNKDGLFVQTPLPGEYPLHVMSGGRQAPHEEFPERDPDDEPAWVFVHHDNENSTPE